MAAPGTQRWLPPVVGLSTFVVILLGVEILIRVGLINRFIVPLPSEVLASFGRVIAEENIWRRFLLDGMGMSRLGTAAHRVRRCARRAAASRAALAACLRNLGGGDGFRAASIGLSAISRAVRPQFPDHHHAGLHCRPRAGHPQDHRGPVGDAARAARCRAKLQADAGAAVLENLLSVGAADDSSSASGSA